MCECSPDLQRVNHSNESPGCRGEGSIGRGDKQNIDVTQHSSNQLQVVMDTFKEKQCSHEVGFELGKEEFLLLIQSYTKLTIVTSLLHTELHIPMFLSKSRAAVAVYGREDSSWMGGRTR